MHAKCKVDKQKGTEEIYFMKMYVKYDDKMKKIS